MARRVAPEKRVTSGGPTRSQYLARLNKSPRVCFFCGKEDGFWVTHHKDHNHDNDAVENLVWAHDGCHSRYHNSYEASGHVRVDNKSGRPGVHYRKQRSVWVARKVVDGKRYYVGSAKTPEGAAALLEMEED